MRPVSWIVALSLLVSGLLCYATVSAGPCDNGRCILRVPVKAVVQAPGVAVAVARRSVGCVGKVAVRVVKPAKVIAKVRPARTAVKVVAKARPARKAVKVVRLIIPGHRRCRE